MRKINGLSAAILAVVIGVGSSAFADSRHQNETWRGQDRGRDRGGNSDRGGYRDNYGTVRGGVDRIDFRNDTLVLRDQATGRFVTVDMRRAGHRSRSVDLDDLRRGDYISLSGAWVRGGVFAASRVESVRSGRGYRRY